MAYTIPDTFTHGDIPTHLQFNAIKDALDYLYSVIVASDFFAVPATSEAIFVMQHTQRWLYFSSTGTYASLDGGNSFSLSENADQPYYDLNSVSWLAFGDIVRISGVSWCVEDTTAPSQV